MGKIVSINVSPRTHTFKHPVSRAELVEGKGIKGDAHMGKDHRQVSLMMMESIQKQKQLYEQGKAKACPAADKKPIAIGPGVYAENLTTEGIDLLRLRVGDVLRAGQRVILRVTQIGKECHTHCQIYHQVGDCIMPRQGIFCEVIQGGSLNTGDIIETD